MRSMTGHGRGMVDGVTVEVRAVNHRHLEVKLRASLDPETEARVHACVRAEVERGALTLTVDADSGELGRIDPDRARAAHRALAALAYELGCAPPELGLVLAQPGVVRASPAVPAAPMLAALGEALAALGAMRAREGAALAVDLGARLAAISAAVDRISVAAADSPARLRTRLLTRLAAADVAGLEPARLAQEAALLAERADITEELVRLRSHLAQAQALLSAPGPVGRRLDFLATEMAREFGTVAAKAADAEIGAWVIDCRAELEKVREQAQNVE